VIRLLFSSAGRRVELINCFKRAARELRHEVETIAIDLDPSWSPACQIADSCYQVPPCTTPEFLDSVLDICLKHQVHLIVPTIDTELMAYAESRSRFEDHGTRVLVPCVDFVRLARDKEATARVLGEHGIPTPRTWDRQEALTVPRDLHFPLLVKPRDGSGSKGIATVNSEAELELRLRDAPEAILQEICVGREFTANCFYHAPEGCVACVPHARKFVRAGEVCFAETVRVPAFRDAANRLAEAFPDLGGCICLQGYLDDTGRATFFEINARFGGGYPVCDMAGGTFAKWLLQELCGQTPDYGNEWREGVRMLRYDAAVFLGC
jgi:carbamoyl-phosphate synthase large subunit